MEKMQTKTVLKLYQVVKAIIDNENIPVKPATKFQLLCTVKKFEPVVENYEKIRNELIQKYGKNEVKEVTDENGETKQEATGNIFIDEKDHDSFKQFQNEINSVIESTVDVDLKKFKPEEIFNMGIPSDYLSGLFEMIEG